MVKQIFYKKEKKYMKKYALLIAIVFICACVCMAQEQNDVATEKNTSGQNEPAKKEGFAKDKEVKKEEPSQAKSAKKEGATPATQKKYTRSELIAGINNLLNKHPKIAATIRGLESVKQESGETSYTFNGKKLDELDDDTLSKVFSTARQMLTIERVKQVERQQRQIQNIQQVERVNTMQRLTQQNTNMPPPRIYIPPKEPKTNK